MLRGGPEKGPVRFLPILALTGALAAQEWPRAARVVVFEAKPRLVKPGESVELRWATAGAEKVWLDPPGVELPAQGRMSRVPEGNTVYWLFAGNQKGGQSIPLAVEVQKAVEVPPKGFWIQFAALANADRARHLQAALRESMDPSIRLFQVVAPRSSDHFLQRVRMGPFPSREAARQRLRELRPKAQALHLKPVVMAD